MRRDRQSVRIAVLAGVIAVGLGAPAAIAGVIAHVDGGGPASADGSGPNAAYAIGYVTTSNAVFTDSGSLFISGCAPCTPDTNSDAHATGSGLTGAAKVFVGASLADPFGFSGAFGRVTIDDVVTFNSPAASFTLDTFYKTFFSGRTASSLFYESHAFLQVSVNLMDLEESVLVFQAVIELNDSYSTFPLPVDGRSYSICEGIDAPCLPVQSGTSFPISNGHFSHTSSLDLTGLVGKPLGLVYEVQASASCNSAPVSGACTSIADTWNTSYLGLQGSFTSQNGYQYLGPASDAVPEPSSLSLMVLGCLAGVVWRVRSLRSRARE